MSRYLLDTNICIHLQKGDAYVRQHFTLLEAGSVFISEITVAELLYGIANAPQAFRAKEHIKFDNLLRLFADSRILPISDAIPQYAELKAHLRRLGRLQGEFDMLIGSTALAYDLTLVTRNGRHFADMPELGVEDWANRFDTPESETV